MTGLRPLRGSGDWINRIGSISRAKEHALLLLVAGGLIRPQFSVLALLRLQVSRIRACLFLLLVVFVIGWERLAQDLGFFVMMIGFYVLFEAIVFRIQKVYKK